MTGIYLSRLDRQLSAITMRDKGCSLKDIADNFGVTRATVYNWLKEPSKTVAKKRVAVSKNKAQRNADVVKLFKSGISTHKIGNKYLISASTVCLILRNEGVSRHEGGISLKAKNRIDRKVFLANKANKIKYLWGLTLDQYDQIKHEYGPSSNINSPIHKYVVQKNSAKKRQIEWQFTFADWWRIWQESGKWNKRGRGVGYCMARFNDLGPYAPNNVEIILSTQNSSDYHCKIKKCVKVYDNNDI
jgi:transposase|tara:strand:+ start:476 stop:1210 length:735 start_codon:yes stop_codon:yes gene_type:complete